MHHHESVQAPGRVGGGQYLPKSVMIDACERLSSAQFYSVPQSSDHTWRVEAQCYLHDCALSQVRAGPDVLTRADQASHQLQEPMCNADGAQPVVGPDPASAADVDTEGDDVHRKR